MPNTLIREAVKEDLPAMLALIQELAAYEKAPQEVSNTVSMMEEDGFGPKPVYWAYVAEKGNEIIGLSLYYIRYSTWKGKCLYLEDIIIKEAHRNQGIGKQLFEKTILAAKKMEAKSMIWQVLDWNKPAIDFYRQYPCTFDAEWINCKLSEAYIQTFNPSDTPHKIEK